jgi:hypothetical protein
MVLAPRTLFEKKDKVMRAPKKVLHVLQFFVEPLHGEVCRIVPNTPKVRHKLLLSGKS